MIAPLVDLKRRAACFLLLVSAFCGHAQDTPSEKSQEQKRLVAISEIQSRFDGTKDPVEKVSTALKIARLYTQNSANLKPDYAQGILWYERGLKILQGKPVVEAFDISIELATLYRVSGRTQASSDLLRSTTKVKFDEFFDVVFSGETKANILAPRPKDVALGVVPGTSIYTDYVNSRTEFEKRRYREIYDKKMKLVVRGLLWGIYRQEGLAAVYREAKLLPDHELANQIVKEIVTRYGDRNQ